VVDRKVDVPVEVAWVRSHSQRWNSCHDDDLDAKKIHLTRGKGSSRDSAHAGVRHPSSGPMIRNRTCRIGDVGAIGIGTSLDQGKDNRMGNRERIAGVDKRRPGSVAD
jgi:hypothetical protein